MIDDALCPGLGVPDHMGGVLQDDLLGRMVKANRHQPASVCHRLNFLAHADPAKPEQEAQ